jgi:hypothetical protein
VLLLGNLRVLLELLGVSLKDLAKKSEIPFWDSSRAKTPRAGVAGWRWRGLAYAHQRADATAAATAALYRS